MNRIVLSLFLLLIQFTAISQNFDLAIDTFKVEDCSARDSILLDAENIDPYDMIDKCSYFYVEWPTIKENSWIHNRMEQHLREYICGLIQSDQIDSVEFTSTMSDAFILKHNKNSTAEWSITCSIFPQYSFVHQFQISHGGYYYGAAHGFGYSRYFHFNNLTGKEIGLEQLFDTDDLTLLTNFVLNKLQAAMNHEWDESITSDFFLTENFLLTEEGINFYYDAYEIGPYAMGYPEISLTWSEIATCLSVK